MHLTLGTVAWTAIGAAGILGLAAAAVWLAVSGRQSDERRRAKDRERDDRRRAEDRERDDRRRGEDRERDERRRAEDRERDDRLRE
jgi:Flp pilus assembly protein TadB